MQITVLKAKGTAALPFELEGQLVTVVRPSREHGEDQGLIAVSAEPLDVDVHDGLPYI